MRLIKERVLKCFCYLYRITDRTVHFAGWLCSRRAVLEALTIRLRRKSSIRPLARGSMTLYIRLKRFVKNATGEDPPTLLTRSSAAPSKLRQIECPDRRLFRMHPATGQLLEEAYITTPKSAFTLFNRHIR